MRYYQDFKTQFAGQADELTAEVEQATLQANRLRKQLKSERDNDSNLSQKRHELNEGAVNIEGDADWKKFESNCHRISQQLRKSKDMVVNLADTILPSAERKLAEAQGKIQAEVDRFVHSQKAAYEKRVIELAEAFLTEPQDFYDSVKKLCNDYHVRPKLGHLAVNAKIGKHRIILSDGKIEIQLLHRGNWPKPKAETPCKKPEPQQFPMPVTKEPENEAVI